TSFTKSWTLKNTSSNCAWDSTIALRYPAGAAAQLSTSQAPSSVVGIVLPGASYTFSIPMRAPTAASLDAMYRESWRLTDASGETINVSACSSVWAHIIVPKTQPPATALSLTTLTPQTITTSTAP